MKHLVTLAALLLLGFSAFSQKYMEDKEDYLKKIYPVANEHLAKGRIDLALKNFKGLDDILKDNANVKYKVGRCYLETNTQQPLAIPYLEQAARFVNKKDYKDSYKETQAPPKAIYYLALAYHYSFDLDNAIKSYQAYKAILPSSDVEEIAHVDRQIEMASNAKVIFPSPIDVEVENLGKKINSAFDEYAPVVDASETILIFTSRRPGSTGGFTADDDKPFEDIYVSTKRESGEWGSPVNIGPNINSDGHEATISLSADGQQLFVYRDDWGDGNIYTSTLEGEGWSELKPLSSYINTKSRETHASVTANGQILYFTSDREDEGGKGGMDIYYSRKLPNGEWGRATNIGDKINTPYDEEACFIHPDSKTLFFSSKGHTSIGGFDIFFSVMDEKGVWGTPRNIGYPVNTPGDDLFFATTPDGKRAYYSSTKDSGFGEKDIYLITLDLDREIPLTVFKGRVIADADGVIPNTVITVTDLKTGEAIGTYKPRAATGQFILILHPGEEYNIAYEAKGYVFHSENLRVPENSSYFEINKTVELQPIKYQKQ